MKNNFLLKLLLILIATSAVISCGGQRLAAAKVNVSGNWQVTISVAAGTIIGKGLLSQNGEIVAGGVGPDDNDPILITGSLKMAN